MSCPNAMRPGPRRHLLWLALLLSGCTVGPTFSPPSPDLPPTWQESVAVSRPIERQWWHIFADPTLDILINQADGANLTIRMAAERVQAARVEQGSAAAQSSPVINGTAGYTRESIGSAGLNDATRTLLGVQPAPGTDNGYGFDVYSLGASASWEPDLWGRQRRQREIADARLDSAEAEATGARLSVRAAIARSYFQWLGLEEESILVDRSIILGQEYYRAAVALRTRGLAAETDVIDAESRLYALSVQREEVTAQRILVRRAIAVLVTGRPDDPLPELDQAERPPRIGPAPLRLPSDMARHRPDIQAAEAKLHAATAAIGVAEADFYPNISLTGEFSIDTLSLATFGWNSRSAAIGPTLSIPIFNGGRLTRQVELRQSEQRSAALAYQATVVAAWQEVEDSLAKLRPLETEMTMTESYAADQSRRVRLAGERFARGDIALIDRIAAEQDNLDAETKLIRQRTSLLIEQIQLVLALGG